MSRVEEYILDEANNVVPIEGTYMERALRWGQWLRDNGARRIVGRDEVGPGVEVSTVFIGLDHNYDPRGKHAAPLVFETMIFGGPDANKCDRYASWDEAAAGHALHVQEQTERLHAQGERREL